MYLLRIISLKWAFMQIDQKLPMKYVRTHKMYKAEKNEKIFKKVVDKSIVLCYYIKAVCER